VGLVLFSLRHHIGHGSQHNNLFEPTRKVDARLNNTLGESMTNRKQLIKQARKIPVEDVEAFLAPDQEVVSGYFLVGIEPSEYIVCYWHKSNGLMGEMIDDEVFSEACVQHLLKIGAPIFNSVNEIENYAAAHGWPKRTA
jgi:hypothetical protein